MPLSRMFAPAAWRVWPGLVALLLGACASTPTPIPPPAPPTPLPSLAAEQRWLDGLFKGTPVTVVSDDDGGVWVEVPQADGFDAGQATPRPALAAVLDKVATSLRRQPQARVRIIVPADGGPQLSNERATKVRDHLYTRGVLVSRIIIGIPAARPLVRLQMLMAPAPLASEAATTPRASR